MASNVCHKPIFVASLLVLVLSLQTALALGHEVTCENLKEDTCAFAVSWKGKRCVLEKSVKRSGMEAYMCRTSEIEADKVKNMIESDRCVKACGLDRKSLGISSDALLEPRFTRKLCSVQCYNQCPNVVDLYFNLAAGEGVFLPKLCEAEAKDSRREMSEIRSSGIALDPLAPVGSVGFFGVAPEPAETVDVQPPSVEPVPSPY